MWITKERWREERENEKELGLGFLWGNWVINKLN